jgi:hypothetical protein
MRFLGVATAQGWWALARGTHGAAAAEISVENEIGAVRQPRPTPAAERRSGAYLPAYANSLSMPRRAMAVQREPALVLR